MPGFSCTCRPWVPALLVLAIAGACTEEPAPEAVEPDVRVSPVMLPVSRRSDGRPPDGALRVELAPEGLVVAGDVLVPMENGVLPANAWNGERVLSLSGAIDVAGRPASAVIRAHAMVPYITVSRVLATLSSHEVRTVFFEVRPGAGVEVGMLPMQLVGTRAPSYEPVVFQGPAQRQWQEFVDVWDEADGGCRGEGTVDCNRKEPIIAEGGLVEIELFTRQDAMRVLLRRHGVEGESVEEPAPLMPTQNTREAPTPEEAKRPPVEVRPPAARSATFMWRRRAAHADPSPISLFMRPLCGARPCAIRMAGDNLTPIAQVLQLLGAAFPNGAPVPIVLWEVPDR